MQLSESLTSVSLGLLATTSPCVLPLYPGYLAYLSGGPAGQGPRVRRYFLGFFVLAGVLTMMLALGLLIALLSVSVGSALALILPLADLLIVALGVLLLTGRNPFKALPQVRIPLLRRPFVNAYVYGPVSYTHLTLPTNREV